MYSPVVGSIKVIRSGRVKKAKLYYLRDRKGKSARISEKIRKKIGVDISEQLNEKEIVKETVTTENKQSEQNKKQELKKDNISAAEQKNKVSKVAEPKSEIKNKELKTEKK